MWRRGRGGRPMWKRRAHVVDRCGEGEPIGGGAVVAGPRGGGRPTGVGLPPC
jgi:hypothetical protein